MAASELAAIAADDGGAGATVMPATVKAVTSTTTAPRPRRLARGKRDVRK